MNDDPLHDIWRSAERMLSRPKFTFTFIISVALVYSHVMDADNSLFSMLLPKDSDNDFIGWLRKDFDKICGVAMMIPTAIDAPQDRRGLVFLALTTLVLLVDTLTLWEYFALSIFFEIWNHVVAPITHIVMAAAFFTVLQLNWLTIKLSPVNNSTDSSVTTPTP